jgi:hypothetical protein
MNITLKATARVHWSCAGAESAAGFAVSIKQRIDVALVVKTWS